MTLEEQIKQEEAKEAPNIALLQKLYRKLGEQKATSTANSTTYQGDPSLCRLEDPSCESCQ